MGRNINRYENDRKHAKKKQEKKLRSPVSKGSVRSKEKRDLARTIDQENKYYGDYDEDQ